MNTHTNRSQSRTARIAGLVAVLLMTAPALLVAVDAGLAGNDATATSTVLANNAGPANPPTTP
ncbi:hypothetical protein ACIQZN_06370 [Streptomyces sp. NPDC097595]|uniref:hypothetical protein n=1 Tax=Streptomyces sp. NPDC097595 TaxID=3366090 RepID=UPI0037F298F4